MFYSYSIIVIIMSTLTFILYGLDKYKAIKNKRRTPENTLFLFGFLLGATGALLAIFLFRHKSNKLSFKLLNLFFLAIHISIAIYLYTEY